MFKRIHSNRDPDETLWKALNQEFGTYFRRAGTQFGQLCLNYPKAIFGGMVALLLLSAALSFTGFYYPAKKPASGSAAPHPNPASVKSPHPLDDGFSRILETGAALKQTFGLKQEVESILAKGKLSNADSLRLEQVLDSLAVLQHQIQH
ncbi:hypothetical protein [Mucilaginibacter jinjuensis]|uniref:Uncharacterized protein n=1 Tax=Mucilaginibacter jinjuensis TaxID=1176721 RepID=A0ABY7TDT2_9SPHI|nr:hypothetical protein [Mucilaginibacter jinjuensis]WCT13327.1 hypothetical protein PQO05_05195 [Mucilaginibacter jinjuensis]